MATWLKHRLYNDYTSILVTFWGESYYFIPPDSHSLGASLKPGGWKLQSQVCGPISHAWLKNVSCCRLAWHNFQKYVNSDPCKERKPCVKSINDNTFLAICDFWSEGHWERAHVYAPPKTGTLDVFGRLRNFSGIFGNDCVVFKNPSTSRIKISRLYLRKSWQVGYIILVGELWALNSHYD